MVGDDKQDLSLARTVQQLAGGSLTRKARIWGAPQAHM